MVPSRRKLQPVKDSADNSLPRGAGVTKGVCSRVIAAKMHATLVATVSRLTHQATVVKACVEEMLRVVAHALKDVSRPEHAATMLAMCVENAKRSWLTPTVVKGSAALQWTLRHLANATQPVWTSGIAATTHVTFADTVQSHQPN